MDIGEFITYCTLKDLIVSHQSFNEWHARAANKKILVIENDDWLASITYTNFAGKYHVLDTTLSNVLPNYDVAVVHTDLENIISKFI